MVVVVLILDVVKTLTSMFSSRIFLILIVLRISTYDRK